MTLRHYVKNRIFYGVKTGLNQAFIVDTDTRDRLIREDRHAAEIIKPFLRGRDIKRWSAQNNEQWLIYTRKGIDISRYPSIAAYMRPFKQSLEGRATKQEWYELQQPQYAYSPSFEAPKIVYPDIYEHQSFAIDLTGSTLQIHATFFPSLKSGYVAYLIVLLLSGSMRIFRTPFEAAICELSRTTCDKFPFPSRLLSHVRFSIYWLTYLSL